MAGKSKRATVTMVKHVHLCVVHHITARKSDSEAATNQNAPLCLGSRVTVRIVIQNEHQADSGSKQSPRSFVSRGASYDGREGNQSEHSFVSRVSCDSERSQRKCAPSGFRGQPITTLLCVHGVM